MQVNNELEIEQKFIERFVMKNKRDRYLEFIKNNKNRSKFTQKLAHFQDLRYELFEEVIGPESQLIKERIKYLGKLKDCYVISESAKFDQKRLGIDIAIDGVVGCGMGTLIIFGDNEIVYYEAEGPGDRWISIANK